MNRIAIVEDDQGYRDTLFTYIKQYEQERDTAFEATPFEKADDFLAVYNGDYDIILMDIEMPGNKRHGCGEADPGKMGCPGSHHVHYEHGALCNQRI